MVQVFFLLYFVHDSCSIRLPSPLRKFRLRQTLSGTHLLVLPDLHALLQTLSILLELQARAFFSPYTLEALECQHRLFDQAFCVQAGRRNEEIIETDSMFPKPRFLLSNRKVKKSNVFNLYWSSTHCTCVFLFVAVAKMIDGIVYNSSFLPCLCHVKNILSQSIVWFGHLNCFSQ